MTLPPHPSALRPILEKRLIGDDYPVLRLLPTENRGMLRLVLSQEASRAELDFGGDVGTSLNEAECKKFFEMIRSEDDFHQLSKMVRWSVGNGALGTKQG